MGNASVSMALLEARSVPLTERPNCHFGTTRGNRCHNGPVGSRSERRVQSVCTRLDRPINLDAQSTSHCPIGYLAVTANKGRYAEMWPNLSRHSGLGLSGVIHSLLRRGDLFKKTRATAAKWTTRMSSTIAQCTPFMSHHQKVNRPFESWSSSNVADSYRSRSTVLYGHLSALSPLIWPANGAFNPYRNNLVVARIGQKMSNVRIECRRDWHSTPVTE